MTDLNILTTAATATIYITSFSSCVSGMGWIQRVISAEILSVRGSCAADLLLTAAIYRANQTGSGKVYFRQQAMTFHEIGKVHRLISSIK